MNCDREQIIITAIGIIGFLLMVGLVLYVEVIWKQ